MFSHDNHLWWLAGHQTGFVIQWMVKMLSNSFTYFKPFYVNLLTSDWSDEAWNCTDLSSFLHYYSTRTSINVCTTCYQNLLQIIFSSYVELHLWGGIICGAQPDNRVREYRKGACAWCVTQSCWWSVKHPNDPACSQAAVCSCPAASAPFCRLGRAGGCSPFFPSPL